MCAADALTGLMRHRIISAPVCLLLLFLIAGCPLESRNPLGKPAEAKIDEKLLGRWKYEDKESKESGLATISRFNESELLIIIKDEGKEEQEIMRGFVTDIGGEKFLNLQDLKGGCSARKWIFVRYATGDCSLTYRVVNDSLASGCAETEMSSAQLYELLKKNIDNKHIYGDSVTLSCVGK